MACTCRSTARELRKSCLAIARLERAVGRPFQHDVSTFMWGPVNLRCHTRTASNHLHSRWQRPRPSCPLRAKWSVLRILGEGSVEQLTSAVTVQAGPDIPERTPGQVAADVVEVVSDERSAFSRWNVIAEIERQLHVHLFATPADRESATRAVVEGPYSRNVRCS